MSVVKQRDLTRFKKTRQGLIEFACILEQASPQTRERIIAEVRQLDPKFIRSALKKVVYFDEIVFLDESALAEIMSHISPKVLAFALEGTPSDFSKKILGTLSYRMQRQFQDEKEKMGTPTSSTVFGAQIQILKIARELEAKNKIVFELLDCPRFKAQDKKHLRLVPQK